MRFVDRSKIPTPAVLADTDSAAADERDAARAHMLHKKRASEFPFKVYKHPDVVLALEDLFFGKCAYCEHPYAAGSKVDVEHYRPKASVLEDQGHPGYWWLASDWENLLPSCEHCNRRQRHRHGQTGMTALAVKQAKTLLVSGKHASFPIEGTRASSQAHDHDAELPLLINPCKSDPTQHLSWILNEELSLLHGKDAKGKASVKTFGLNRQRLVEARTKLKLRISEAIVSIQEKLDFALSLEPIPRSTLLQLVANDIRRLYGYTAATEAFSAFASSLITAELDQLRSRYTDLL